MRRSALPGVNSPHRLVQTWLILGVIFCALTPVAASAITALSEGYTTEETLSLGSIVSLKADTPDIVMAANSENVENILGVVVSSGNSLLSVTSGTASQVQVATSGTVTVLASDVNGDIKRGDHITASPLSGVGMKANGNVRVIGIAQNSLKGTNQTYKDKSGKEQTVKIGELSLLVNVAYYFKEPEKTIIPTSLQNVANSLAGREVSTAPILISLAIFIVTIIVVVSIIYSMVRNGIISVGRNPMAQSAVYRNVIQMSALVIMILGIGIVTIYLVLTRL